MVDDTGTGMLTATGHQLHRMLCILRPDANGQWYIQNDTDHKSFGVLPTINQTSTYLEVLFDKSYSHAGVIHITSDDDFRDRVSGHGNLGLTATRIQVVIPGIGPIDPADIHNHITPGAGNFWVSIEMFR